MVLVDTSVWIDHFRGGESPESARLARLLEDEEDLCICGLILTEILQGIRSDTEFKRTERSLSSLVYLPTPRDAYLTAAKLYRNARRNGITIRRSLDCAIAGCAIENRVPILHKDRDFDRIARFSLLKTLRTVN
jgi:predicted nucleic acid-binding protein